MATGTSSTSSTALVGDVSKLLGAKPTSSNTQQIGAKTASPSDPTSMGKNAFLQLLVTQLKNQDPQKPMDDTQFVSQMAQFSSLEQMQNLNQTMTAAAQFQSLAEASSMIGKYVSLLDPSTNSQVTGQVQQISSSSGNTSVMINGQSYDASSILQVSASPIAPSSAPAAPATGTTGTSATAAPKSTSTTSSTATSGLPAAGTTGSWIGL